MKSFKIITLIILLFGVSDFLFSQVNEDFPILKGPYLGQKPPGTTAEIFAPGIISKGGSEISAVFSPDGTEFYFSAKDPVSMLKILYSKLENGIWTKPETAPFSGKYYDAVSSISPDGRFLYFMSMRPQEDGGIPFDVQHIWVLERQEEYRNAPVMLPPPINSDAREMGGTLTRSGYFYFNTTREGIKGRKCRSKFIDGKYSPPESIQDLYKFKMPFFEIARDPDEKFMIFASFDQDDGYGGFDLYVSFNKGKDNWTKPVNLGEKINTDANEHFATLSPDGKYLFFVSDRVAEKFKSKENLSPKELKEMEKSPQNGNSDIYWVSLDVLEKLKK